MLLRQARRSWKDKYYCKENKSEVSECPSPTKKRPASNRSEELSEYERKVQQNIAERQALLEELNFDQLKADLKPPKKEVKRKCYEGRRPPSLRLQNLSPNGSPVTTTEPKTESHPFTLPLEQRVAPIRKSLGPLRMKKVLSQLYGDPDYKAADNFFDEISTLEAYGRSEVYSSTNCSLERFTSWISSATLTLNSICKVVHGKIASLALHPSEEKVIICAGAAAGELGIIEMNSEKENKPQFVLSPHGMMINRVAFCQQDPNKLYTSSCDGTVLCVDFHYKVFKKVFATIDAPQLIYPPTMFDFLDSNVICVTHGSASLSVVDQRQKGITSSSDGLHNHNIRSVSVHPVQRHYVMTTGKDDLIAVWDLRYLKNSSVPVAQFNWQNPVYAALFSPLTGNSVLVTGNHHIGILESLTNEKTLKCTTKISKTNFGGRWLNNFIAVWHPQREDVFVVGSWHYPRQIEMRSISGSLLYAFSDDLTSICSICQFHPSLPILVGSNSSGKIFAYM